MRKFYKRCESLEKDANVVEMTRTFLNKNSKFLPTFVIDLLKSASDYPHTMKIPSIPTCYLYFIRQRSGERDDGIHESEQQQ